MKRSAKLSPKRRIMAAIRRSKWDGDDVTDRLMDHFRIQRTPSNFSVIWGELESYRKRVIRMSNAARRLKGGGK